MENIDSIEGVPDNIMARINKLYAKAMSSREIGSLEEAESFMLGVQKLLSEYNLEMSMLGGNKEKSVIGQQKVDYEGLVSYGEWEVNLMNAICEYNWCSCIYNSHFKTITVIGRTENIDVCIYLYNFIRINLVTLSKLSFYTTMGEWNKKLSERNGYNVADHYGRKFEEFLNKNKCMPYRRYYIRDYLAGAVIGIRSKFEYQQMQQASNSGVNGLILFNKEKITEYMKDNFPNMKTVTEKDKKRGMGYNEGYLGGFNLKIGEALGGKADAGLLEMNKYHLHTWVEKDERYKFEETLTFEEWSLLDEDYKDYYYYK